MADSNSGIHTFRFYDDDSTNVNGCTAITTEGQIDGTRLLDDPFHIRIGTWNDSAANFSAAKQLQARIDGGSWFNVSTTSSYVRTYDGLPTNADTCSTQLMASYSTYSWENDGIYDDDNGITPVAVHSKNTFWEDQWCIVLRSAELSGGEKIEFRTVPSAGIENDPATFPTIYAAVGESYDDGAGAGSLAAVTGAATGTYTGPSYSGAGAAVLAALLCAAAGTFADPLYTDGAGAATLAPVAQSAGAGTYADPTYTGAGAGTLGPIAQSAGTGTYAPGGEATGDGAGALAALTGTGAGSYSDTIILFDSTHIPSGGADTTARLDPPPGMTSGDFSAGRIEDVDNPTDSVGANEDGYTELEIAIQFLVSGDWKFRLTRSGTPIPLGITPTATVSGAPVGDGSGALAPITGAATGSYAAPAYSDGAGAGTLAPLTGAATGDLAYPAGDGAGTLAALTGAAAGGIAYPSGDGAGALAPLTAAGSGTFTAETVLGDGAGSLAPITGSATGVAGDPQYTGDGAGTLAALTQTAGTGTYAGPAYTDGAGDGTLAAAAGTATGTYADATYTGDGAATLAAISGTATGSYAVPGWAGFGDGTLAAAAQTAGDGTYAGPQYSGDGAGTLAALSATGTGGITYPEWQGDGAGSLAPITGSATGTSAPGAYTGDGAAALQALQGAGAGTWAAPSYDGAGAGSLAPLVASGAGTYVAGIYTGAGAATLPAITGSGAGIHFVSDAYGWGDATLPAVTGTGQGSYRRPLDTKYGPQHAAALATLAKKGAPVTFTHVAMEYDALGRGSSAVPTMCGGNAIQVKGDPREYEAAGMVLTSGPTLLLAPDPQGTEPPVGATCQWAGATYTVKGVIPIGPDGPAILARVLLADGVGATEAQAGAKYADKHASALAMLRKKGKAVSFVQTVPTYDPSTGLTVSVVTVPGWAIGTRGDPRVYEAMGLVMTEAPMLLFAAATYGQVPAVGARVEWEGKPLTVQWVDPVAPDGSVIVSKVLVAS